MKRVIKLITKLTNFYFSNAMPVYPSGMFMDRKNKCRLQ